MATELCRRSQGRRNKLGQFAGLLRLIQTIASNFGHECERLRTMNYKVVPRSKSSGRLFNGLTHLTQYLAIRDSFADQWQPRRGIESAMIEMLAISYSLQMYWSTIAHDRATRTHDAQREQVRRFESSSWKSPYQLKRTQWTRRIGWQMGITDSSCVCRVNSGIYDVTHRLLFRMPNKSTWAISS